MLHATVPIAVALVGALIYALSTSPKLAELGRISFGAALLVALVVLSRATISLP